MRIPSLKLWLFTIFLSFAGKRTIRPIMDIIPILKFMFRSEWKALNEALSLNPAYAAKDFGSADELTTFLNKSPIGLVIFSLRDKSDLLQLAILMKLVKKIPSETFVKIIVINFSANKELEKAIERLGILDLFEDRIQTKALKFKIDFMMKSMLVQLKMNSNGLPGSAKKIEETKVQDNKVMATTPSWINPIECCDDVWFLKNENDCKKIITRWLVKVVGPSPYVASWVETGTAGVWKFEFKSNPNMYISGDGAWFYRGSQKPDFTWTENVWIFTGEAFDLFYKQENEIISRLNLKDKKISIAKNSKYAKIKEKVILESFDKDLVLRRELQAIAEDDAFDAENERLRNLEGKGKTDAIDQDHLSGKTKAQANRSGPLSGKSKTDALNGGPLSGQVDSSDEGDSSSDMSMQGEKNAPSPRGLSHKTDGSSVSSFWDGKDNFKEGEKEDFDAPSDQDISSGAALSLDARNKHEKFYKNHNEAEKYAAKEREHALRKDGIAENLQGKTDPGKSSGKGSPNLSGESSTDEIEGHLSSPDFKKNNGIKEKNKSASELSGKSATDKLEGKLSSPSEKRNKATANQTENELSGKSSTDNIPGRLTSPRLGKNKNDDQGEASNDSFDDKFLGHANEAKDKEDSLLTPQEKKKRSEQLRAEQERKEKSRQGSPFLKDPSQTNSAETDEDFPDLSSNQASNKSSDKRPGQKTPDNVLPFTEAAPQNAAEDGGVSAKELEDSTSNAQVVSYLIQDKVRVLCKLDDHFDQTIIFSTSDKGIATDETVTMSLNFNYMNKDTKLNFTGKVVEIEQVDEESQYVTVEISKENAVTFNSFMKLYNSRQKNINTFFKAVKGF
jgi:hypothetical protein